MKADEFDVTVLTTGHDVADARLHRLVSVLSQDEGLQVEVHGLGLERDGPPEAAVRARPRRGLVSRAVAAALLPWRAHGRVLVVLDPDLVLPALVRRSVARWTGGRGAARRVVVDVHEDYAKALRDRSWARGLRLVAARVLVSASVLGTSRADLAVVADEHLPPRRAPRRLVLRNRPLRRHLPAPREGQVPLRALYVGDVRRSRGLRSMLSALEACPEWSLDIVGPVAPADRPWLDSWSRSSEARGRVRFHGRQPPREAWRLAREASVGLCLLQPTPAFVAALPSKVLEYLSCGLAVVTTPLPRAAALVLDSGAGVVAEDVSEVVAVLRRWSSDPPTVLAHRRAARRWARSELSDERQYARFGRAVVELLEEEARACGS